MVTRSYEAIPQLGQFIVRVSNPRRKGYSYYHNNGSFLTDPRVVWGGDRRQALMRADQLRSFVALDELIEVVRR